ncbi:MAG TPA: hypothetical protein GX526_06370 [Thermoanaerobacterales bacterium]|nr:hypothetical protein [Thermoanaerobacterales bacterium]
MDKDLLLKNMFMAVENTKSIRDNMDKGFDKLLEKNLAKQQRFTISCKAKDLNKELARLEPTLKKILS